MNDIHKLVQRLDRKDISVKELIEISIINNCKFYWHPLGFIMSKLIQEGDLALRFHIWPKYGGKMQIPTWLIHDHIFHMNSWVISGSIINHEYAVENVPASNHVLYEVEYEGYYSKLIRTDDSILIKTIRSQAVQAGDLYEIPAGTLHKSESIIGESSVTVVLTENKLTRSPKVVGDDDGKSYYLYSRNEVDDKSLNEILGSL